MIQALRTTAHLFDSLVVNGLATDSGGRLRDFVRDHPWIKVANLTQTIGGTASRAAASSGVEAMFAQQSQIKAGFRGCHPGDLLGTRSGVFYHIGSAGSNWRKNCPAHINTQCWSLVQSTLDALDGCHTSFLEYVPSPLETLWHDKLSTRFEMAALVTNATAAAPYCEIIKSQKSQVASILRMAPKLSTSVEFDPAVFSRFHHVKSCSSYTRNITSFIEPLFGFLRDPRAACEKLFGDYDDSIQPWHARAFMLGRDFIVMDSFPAARRQLFVDLGASSYTQGPGGSSQQFFFEGYEKRGVFFDKYTMWEVGVQEPVKLLQQVPDRFFYAYQYFNTPAIADPTSDKNPVNMVRRGASVDDFVGFKLDIDNEGLERKFVEQLFGASTARDGGGGVGGGGGRGIAHLIKEFYWEQHEGSLRFQYDELFRMRQMGVRAHTWP